MQDDETEVAVARTSVDGIGTTKYTYSAAGQLLTEDGPFANDTITSVYWSRMRTNLSLLQPTGVWTNAFGYDGANRLNSVASPAGTFTYYYDEPFDMSRNGDTRRWLSILA